jgi:hypothetical protein
MFDIRIPAVRDAIKNYVTTVIAKGASGIEADETDSAIDVGNIMHKGAAKFPGMAEAMQTLILELAGILHGAGKQLRINGGLDQNNNGPDILPAIAQVMDGWTVESQATNGHASLPKKSIAWTIERIQTALSGYQQTHTMPLLLTDIEYINPNRHKPMAKAARNFMTQALAAGNGWVADGGVLFTKDITLPQYPNPVTTGLFSSKAITRSDVELPGDDTIITR